VVTEVPVCDADGLMLRGFGAASGVGARRGELAALGISLAGAGAGATEFAGADAGAAVGSASAFGLLGPLTMASVSETGVTAELGGADAGAAAGAGEAASGAGCTTFCRTAMYAPPAAAVRHPAASKPARTLELILTPEQEANEQLLCPGIGLNWA
jgi:hypothetical protein